MSVQPVDVVGQLAGKDAGLPPAPPAVCRAIAGKISAEGCPGGMKAGQGLGPFPAASNPDRIVLEIFGQVEDLRLDLAMEVMDLALGRAPQRDDELTDAAPFQAKDLLCDEGL
jgi:hypothetical protein